MFTHPDFNMVAISLGPIQIYWYGLMYLLGFAAAWWLGNVRCGRYGLTKQQVSDLVFYSALGVIIGGRVGYMLFYDFAGLVNNPLSIVKIWDGGMSFHGGMLGVIFALWWFSQRTHTAFLTVTDFVAPLVPIGLGAGRIGNFINAELWGRVTDVPWGMVFPRVDDLARHPSQLYQFFFEGILLFMILWIYSAKPRPRMAVSALFLLTYGSFRFITEFFRQPDGHLGFIFSDWITMGQWLSLPMVALGAVLLWWSYRHTNFQKNGVQ